MNKAAPAGKLTRQQLFFLISGIQIGVGILSLPAGLHKVARQDGWISAFIAGLMAALGLVFIHLVCRRFPGQALYDILDSVWGKYLGKFWTGLFIIYFWATGAVIFRIYLEILQVWMLPLTPRWVLIILLMLPVFYLVFNGLTVLGRFAEMLFLISAWIVVLLYFPLREAHWYYLKPIGTAGLKAILLGSFKAALAMLGFEFYWLAYPYTSPRRRLLFWALAANGLVTILYMAVTVIAFAFYSPEEIESWRWPTLGLLKVIQFSFIERMEYVILALWVPVVLLTVIGMFYGAGLGTAHLLKRKDHRYLTLLLVLLAGVVDIFLPDADKLSKLGDYLGYAGLGLGILLPGLSWLLASLLPRGGMRNERN